MVDPYGTRYILGPSPGIVEQQKAFYNNLTHLINFAPSHRTGFISPSVLPNRRFRFSVCELPI